MTINKQFLPFLILVLIICSGLEAQNTNLGAFQGDDLNNKITQYIKNVNKLIPDSSANLNIWSYPTPDKNELWYGFGFNTSFTFMQRRIINSGQQGFGGSNKPDLSQFPAGIPYLPVIALDARAGLKKFDAGINGMLLNENSLGESIGSSFLGSSSHFFYRMIGIDGRYLILKENKMTPSVILNAGYNFTWMGFGISSGAAEKAETDFRTDSFFLAVQTSKTFLNMFTPYIGLKTIFSKTDYGYTWETERPVTIKGRLYQDGARYTAGDTEGKYNTYLQIYSGIGFTYIYNHVITVGFSLNAMTGHFGLNIAARFIK